MAGREGTRPTVGVLQLPGRGETAGGEAAARNLLAALRRIGGANLGQRKGRKRFRTHTVTQCRTRLVGPAVALQGGRATVTRAPPQGGFATPHRGIWQGHPKRARRGTSVSGPPPDHAPGLDQTCQAHRRCGPQRGGRRQNANYTQWNTATLTSENRITS